MFSHPCKETRRNYGTTDVPEWVTFKRGDRWRVLKDGASLSVEIRYPGSAWSYMSVPLPKDTILECSGELYSGGSDGVMLVGWNVPPALRPFVRDEVERMDASSAADVGEFRPSFGGMWDEKPRREYLAPDRGTREPG